MKFVSIQCHLQLHKSQKHCPPSLNSPVHRIYKQLVGIFIYIIATYCRCKLVSKSPRNTALVLLRLFFYKLVEATRCVHHITTQRLTNTFSSHLWSSYQTSQQPDRHKTSQQKLCQNVSSRSRLRNGNETCWIRIPQYSQMYDQDVVILAT